MLPPFYLKSFGKKGTNEVLTFLDLFLMASSPAEEVAIPLVPFPGRLDITVVANIRALIPAVEDGHLYDDDEYEHLCH